MLEDKQLELEEKRLRNYLHGLFSQCFCRLAVKTTGRPTKRLARTRAIEKSSIVAVQLSAVGTQHTLCRHTQFYFRVRTSTLYT
jgi:hypothetical protein